MAEYFFSILNVDIDAIHNSTARLMSEYNFCDLCKLNPAKQLATFWWAILWADIFPLDDDQQQQEYHHHHHQHCSVSRCHDMHVFDLVSTIFHYNQVWDIAAGLLLIGG